MSAHSFLPPSGAAAWSRCALWPTMNQRYPQDGSPESIEGDAAHWVAWEILANRPVKENQATPAGTIVTAEMIEGGEMIADEIRVRIQIWGAEAHIEERASISQIHPASFGTPDVWGLLHRHIEIVDYKFGHRFVDEYFNPQGLCYLFGILERLQLNDEDITVSFTIVQPRCYYRGQPVRTHHFTVGDAMEHLFALKNAALKAYAPEPIALTGKHCQDCPGRHACSALQEGAYSDAEFSNNRQPHDLSPAAAALELRMLERAQQRLEARVEGLRMLTEANLKAGKRVPYYRLEQGHGRTQWIFPPEQVIAIGEMFGKSLGKPAVVTPKQAAKLGIDAAVISEYSFTPKGSIKLVADNPDDARRVFAVNQE